jgi:hypothetical protein
MGDERATHVALPWRYLDIGEIMDANDDVVMTDVPEEIGEFMVTAANRRGAACKGCDGRGYVADDPEGSPIRDCPQCGGLGVDPAKAFALWSGEGPRIAKAAGLYVGIKVMPADHPEAKKAAALLAAIPSKGDV